MTYIITPIIAHVNINAGSVTTSSPFRFCTGKNQ
jgi:hypothetical protein